MQEETFVPNLVCTRHSVRAIDQIGADIHVCRMGSWSHRENS